jgi:hypothetical protein
MFEKIVGEQYIIDLKASIAKEFEERYTQPTSILETVINNDTNEDVLFKTKLAIFEIPQVKNITDKVLKQEIRTATSLLQLFSLLNNIMKSSNNDEPAPES